MNAVPKLSGVDLARQALLAAREAARQNGVGRATKPKRRTGTPLRRDGREPLGLGAAITVTMTERGLVAPAAGGSVPAQWEAILARSPRSCRARAGGEVRSRGVRRTRAAAGRCSQRRQRRLGPVGLP